GGAGAVEAALAAYEDERRPVVASTQRAAQASLEWFENLGQYLDQEPEQFAFNIITRSRRVTHANLRLRDPEFTDRIDAWSEIGRGGRGRGGAGRLRGRAAAGGRVDAARRAGEPGVVREPGPVPGPGARAVRLQHHHAQPPGHPREPAAARPGVHRPDRRLV